MSVRGIVVSTLVVCSVVVLCCSTAFAEESAPPASAGKDAAAATSKSEESAQAKSTLRIGAVQKALQRLYTIPRPTTRPATARTVTGRGASSAAGSGVSSNRLGLQHDDAIRESVSSVPIGGQTTPHRLGMQHADAIRDSVSSVPIGDDLRGGVAGDDRSTTGGVTAGTSVTRRSEGTGSLTQVLVSPDPYYHPRRRLPQDERQWTDYRYFGGRPSRYGYGRNDQFGDGYAGETYRFGFNRGYNTGRFDNVATRRQERTLAHARSHLERGLERFGEGRYRAAADAFKLAAETNQGDPAARLYAAHALFATGRYRDAVKYLHRAFELQPKIVFLDFDMRDDYGKRADFDKQVEALENALKRFPRNGDRLIMLGYVRYYSNQRDKAYEALAKANKLDRRDRLVLRLLENCRPPDVTLDDRKADGRKPGDKTEDDSD